MIAKASARSNPDVSVSVGMPIGKAIACMSRPRWAPALPAVTVCFQVLAIGSGWLASALLEGHPLAETAGRFLDVADPWLALLSLLKSALMGAAVGVIACHHGSSGEGSTRAISGAAIQAVGTGLIAVFVVDVAFAALVYALR